MRLIHPDGIFDRVDEWRELSAFISEPSRLGVVWGPRRAGKSVLLAALAEAAGGLYVEAVRQDSALSLADIGREVGARAGVGTVRYTAWSDAIDGLLSLPNCPVVVLDEFGYLCEASPELPSIIQRAVDRGRRGKTVNTKGPAASCSAVRQSRRSHISSIVISPSSGEHN